MEHLLKKLFKEQGPLSPKRIKKELLGKSVHGRHIVTTAKRENFKGMNVYHINRDKFINPPVVYLHGGAYLHGLSLLHFKLCHELSRTIESPFILLDYPLLPESSHELAYEKVLDYISQFEEYMLMGDSAGGGLALGCVLYHKIHQKVTPKKTVLLSPWVDVTMSHPQVKHMESLDFVLNRETLIELGHRWANKKDVRNFMVSPIYGPCEQLDHIMVTSGDEELFTPDLRKLSSILNKDTCVYVEGKNMFHDYTLFTNMGLAEADRTFKLIAEFLESKK